MWSQIDPTQSSTTQGRGGSRLVLTEDPAGRCTSVSGIAEHCWATRRAVIEGLADEPSDPCIHKATGCAFGVYRSNTRCGSIRIANMRYSEVKGVLVQYSPEKGLTGALSGEGIAIYEGHIYKLQGAEISYVEPKPDSRMGTQAPALTPWPRCLVLPVLRSCPVVLCEPGSSLDPLAETG